MDVMFPIHNENTTAGRYELDGLAALSSAQAHENHIAGPLVANQASLAKEQASATDPSLYRKRRLRSLIQTMPHSAGSSFSPESEEGCPQSFLAEMVEE